MFKFLKGLFTRNKIRVNHPIEVGCQFTYKIERIEEDLYNSEECNGAVMLKKLFPQANSYTWGRYEGFFLHEGKVFEVRTTKDMMEVKVGDIVHGKIITSWNY